MKTTVTGFILILLIITFTAQAEQAKLFADGFTGPENMAFDAKGLLYLTDTDRLWQVGTDGTKKELYTRDPDLDTQSLGGISLGPQGKLYFSTGNRILIYNPADASVSELVSGFEFANGNCMDDRGNLFIADANARVLYVVPAGTSEARVLKPKAGWVNGLVWNRGDNTLYYTISAPGRLGGIRLNDKLEITEEISIASFPLGALDDLTIDGQGNFYVCMWGNSKVMKVDPSGKKELLIKDIDGPSALAFGIGDMSDVLFITVKGSTFKFKGTKLVTLKTAAQGYRLPFLP